MHTLKVKTKDYGEISVHHHGDWTGEVRVIWYVGNDKHEAEFPASLLLALGKASAKDALSQRVITAVEESISKWDPGEVSPPEVKVQILEALRLMGWSPTDIDVWMHTSLPIHNNKTPLQLIEDGKGSQALVDQLIDLATGNVGS